MSAMEPEGDLHAELLERAGDELDAVHGSRSGHGWVVLCDRRTLSRILVEMQASIVAACDVA